MDLKSLIVPVNGIVQLGLQITVKTADKDKQHFGNVALKLLRN